MAAVPALVASVRSVASAANVKNAALIAVTTAAAIVLALGDGCPPRDAARRGWWAGFGYFLLTLHWIVDPFFVDPARDGWMAPFALLALPGGLALFWAVAFGAAAWLAPGAGPGRRGLALAVTFTLAEMLRAVLFTGFPWAMPATIWVETPLRLLASCP